MMHFHIRVWPKPTATRVKDRLATIPCVHTIPSPTSPTPLSVPEGVSLGIMPGSGALPTWCPFRDIVCVLFKAASFSFEFSSGPLHALLRTHPEG
jgi:hypothetical protein